MCQINAHICSVRNTPDRLSTSQGSHLIDLTSVSMSWHYPGLHSPLPFILCFNRAKWWSPYSSVAPTRNMSSDLSIILNRRSDKRYQVKVVVTCNELAKLLGNIYNRPTGCWWSPSALVDLSTLFWEPAAVRT